MGRGNPLHDLRRADVGRGEFGSSIVEASSEASLEGAGIKRKPHEILAALDNPYRLLWHRRPVNRWRSFALWALWAQVVSLFAVSAYALWKGNFTGSAALSATEAFLAGLVMVWWTLLYARVTLVEAIAPTDGVLRALRLVFPGLRALRAALWLMTLLMLLSGAGSEANPVALTTLMTVWGGAIMASNAVYGTLARLVTQPADPLQCQRLVEWLNVAAALSLGMGVLNVVPIAGFSSTPVLHTQVVYGLVAVIDVLATLLARQALRAAPFPSTSEDGPTAR